MDVASIVILKSGLKSFGALSQRLFSASQRRGPSLGDFKVSSGELLLFFYFPVTTSAYAKVTSYP